MLTIFFPAPGVTRNQAMRYLWERGFGKIITPRHKTIYVPRDSEKIRTRQENKLIREITIEPK